MKSPTGALAVGEHERLVRYQPVGLVDPAQTVVDLVGRYSTQLSRIQQPKTLFDLEGTGVVHSDTSTPFIDAVNILQKEIPEMGRCNKDGTPGVNTLYGRSVLLNMIGMASVFYVDSRRIIDDTGPEEALDDLVKQISNEDALRTLKHIFLHPEQKITTFTDTEMSLVSDTPTVAKEIDSKLYDAKVRGLSTPYGTEKFVQAISDLNFLRSIIA
jgi:hypothetical protein